VEEVSVRLTEVAAKEDNGVRADRLLVQAGLAASAAEATRKIKEKAVRVNGELLVGNLIPLAPGPTIDQPVTIQLGRKMKKVTIRS